MDESFGYEPILLVWIRLTDSHNTRITDRTEPFGARRSPHAITHSFPLFSHSCPSSSQLTDAMSYIFCRSLTPLTHLTAMSFVRRQTPRRSPLDCKLHQDSTRRLEMDPTVTSILTLSIRTIEKH